MLTLRLAKRKTTWQVSPVDELIKAEFSRGGQVDLDLSLYVVEKAQVTQTVAEHSASLNVNPRSYPNVDLSGRQVEKTPGKTHFAFTVAAHHELKFNNVDELRAFLLETILPEIESRVHVADRADVLRYARDRRDAGDPEWVSFFEANTWP